MSATISPSFNLNNYHIRQSACTTLEIRNFSNFNSDYAFSHFSPPEDANQIEFDFSIFPKISHRIFSPEVFIYLRLKKNTTGEDKALVHYRVSILGEGGEKQFSQEYFWKFDPSNGAHIAKYIKRSSLLDASNRYLINDSLKLNCEVFILEENERKFNNKNDSIVAPNLSSDMKVLFENAKLSDVTFAVGTKELPAHKAILAARSEVFAAMFEHDCEEKRLSRVVITDVDWEVFEQFLLYIYTDRVELLEQFADELMAVADKYQMNCLKGICEQYLSSEISIETVPRYLLWADLYNAQHLKQKCIDFITDRDHCTEVLATENWKEMGKASTELLLKLFSDLAIKNNKK